MRNTRIAGIAAWTVICATGTAMADVNITLSSSAGSYATTLNFDEVGGPGPGYQIADDSWAGIGVSQLMSGNGSNGVQDFNALFGGWGLGNGQSFGGGFGVFMKFDSDITEFSTQAWDNSGPATFFGGGMIVNVFNDGVNVASLWVEAPAWGGIGDNWFDITTTDGSTFDEVNFAGFGMVPETYVDNMSWNAVPAPSSAVALLGFACLATRRRRA